MKQFHLVVGVLCALLSFFVVTEAAAQEIVCRPDLGSTGYESDAIEKCLSIALDVPVGTTLVVPLLDRIYDAMTQIDCKNREGVKVFFMGPSSSRKATLLANPNLGNQNIFRSTCSNLVLRYIVFNGNKLKRDYETLIKGMEAGKETWHELCNADGWRPANSVFGGEDNEIEDVDSINASCGTAMGVSGKRIKIRRVRIENNGFEPPELLATGAIKNAVPERSHQYSDGITLEYCEDCEVSDSLFTENTDLALVLGGGARNVIHCIQKHTRALGCYNVGRFGTARVNPKTGLPWDGDHEGLVFEMNTVTAEPGMIPYGLTVGSYFYYNPDDPWCKYVVVHNAGVVRHNTIHGAKIGLGVHGVEQGTITDNTLGEALGNSPNFFVPCNLTAKYVVGRVKLGVVLQSGFMNMNLDGGRCPDK